MHTEKKNNIKFLSEIVPFFSIVTWVISKMLHCMIVNHSSEFSNMSTWCKSHIPVCSFVKRTSGMLKQTSCKRNASL
jgi:hypothetical protein